MLHFWYVHSMIDHIKDKNALITLQKAGISKTPQRIAVLNILSKAVTPLNISSIRQSLQLKTKINRVTIYRILSLFKKRGIIRDITSAGISYYELATRENPVHPHFNCLNCGKLSCLEPLTFSQAKHWFNTDENFSIEHIEINISGLCSYCRDAT